MDQAEEIPVGRALAFHAGRGAFARLLLINSLLTLLTLGIYRFWAKTNIRRYFWRNVSFLDDPLEYAGTGGELFVGFLIVIAVLFPLGLVYGAIQTLVPPRHPEMVIALEIAYYAVLFALLQIGFYRMWRYRMSRTRWRGVRFGLDGSTWAYLRLAAGWSLLTFLSLGAAYPWMQIDLWRYQMHHTRLGDQAFRFDGNARELFVPWLPIFAAVLVNVGIAVWWTVTFGFVSAADVGTLPRDDVNAIATAGGVALLVNALAFLCFMYYRVRQARLQISGLRFAEAAFHSRLPFWRLFLIGILCMVVMLAIFAALLGVFAPSVMGNANAWRHGIVDPDTIGGLVGFGFAVFVLFVFVIPFIWTLIFRYEVVRQFVLTTAIDNPHVLERAAQAGNEGPRTGEGLADALDIGGF